MKKFDMTLIIKNLTAILCGGMILSFLLPFISVDVSVKVMGISSSSGTTINGFQVLTDGGFLGILLALCPIIIIVANYLPHLDSYKKIISLIASAVSILILFIEPSQLSAQSGNEVASSNISISHQIGFWLMLIFAILIVALSVIQFFNLKGNKIFDTVNTSTPVELTETDNNSVLSENSSKFKVPQVNIDKDKISGMAKNATNAFSNIANNVSEKVTSSHKENPDNIMESIKKLYELKEAGILTEEEFSTKKQEMLQRM